MDSPRSSSGRCHTQPQNVAGMGDLQVVTAPRSKTPPLTPKTSETGELGWLLAWQQTKEKRDHWALLSLYTIPSSHLLDQGKVEPRG